MKVLIVGDDHRENKLREILERNRCQCRQVIPENGVEEVYLDDRPDVVLLDLDPVNWDKGIKSLTKIQRVDTGAKIVLLVPNGGSLAFNYARQASGVLVRPFSPQQLIDMVLRVAS